MKHSLAHNVLDSFATQLGYGNDFDAALLNDVVFLALKVAEANENKVFGSNLGLDAAHGFELVPQLHRGCVGLVDLTIEIILSERCRERHAVHIARRRGVRAMEVGVRIYPYHAKLCLRPGHLDAGNSAARAAVVSGQHNREESAFQCFAHRIGYALIHPMHTADALGERTFNRFVE